MAKQQNNKIKTNITPHNYLVIVLRIFYHMIRFWLTGCPGCLVCVFMCCCFACCEMVSGDGREKNANKQSNKQKLFFFSYFVVVSVRRVSVHRVVSYLYIAARAKRNETKYKTFATRHTLSVSISIACILVNEKENEGKKWRAKERERGRDGEK